MKSTVKFWPLKDNRRIELEIVAAGLQLSTEFDMDDAYAALDDLRDALAILEADVD